MLSTLVFPQEPQGASPETRAVLHANALRTNPLQIKRVTFQNLDRVFAEDGHMLPIGSVEYVQKCVGLCGGHPVFVDSYPKALSTFLRRPIHDTRFAQVPDDWFVKPKKLKQFTGGIKSELYDRLCVREPIRPTTPVWSSPPILWRSEWRYYVLRGKCVGAGRYDDGPEDAPEPDSSVVRAAISAWRGAPAGYALDFGVLSTGETALVEANDGFALGYYKGTLSPAKYLELLGTRWAQLVCERTHEDSTRTERG